MPETALHNEVITTEMVIDFFLRVINPPISQEDADKIVVLSHWEKRKMTPRSLSGVLFWHFNPNDPNHIGQILTNHGKSHKLADVAQIYLENLPVLMSQYPAFVAKVAKIGEVLQMGQILPPVLIAAGRISNRLSLVDGNFRSLSLMVQSIKSPEKDWQIEALVGRKLYPWEDYLRRGKLMPGSSTT